MDPPPNVERLQLILIFSQHNRIPQRGSDAHKRHRMKDHGVSGLATQHPLKLKKDQTEIATNLQTCMHTPQPIADTHTNVIRLKTIESLALQQQNERNMGYRSFTHKNAQKATTNLHAYVSKA